MAGVAADCPAGAVYTTPWDNYLIWRDVWHYGTDRVVGTIGYVPVEEYLFFLLQPILTGFWLYWLLSRTSEPVQEESSAECECPASCYAISVAERCYSGILVSTSG